MPDNAKKIADAIQKILDANNGFMPISSLDKHMSRDLKAELGFKSADPMKIKAKKLIAATGDRFILRDKRRSSKGKSQMSYYILTPCDPAELIVALLSREEEMTPKGLARRMPFTNRDVCTLLNELVKSGKVQTMYDEMLEPKVFLASGVSPAQGGGKDQSPQPGKYTQAKFREAYDELHRSREFVRICDLRRSLNWPREVFDEMVRRLRDSMAIHMAQAENRYYTPDELADCWVDENNYRMGTIDWNGR